MATTKPKIATRWNRPPTGDGVAVYPRGQTETAYIPHEVQIKRLHEASLNYALWKREQFDFGPDDPVDPDFSDPTRSPGFDKLDAAAYITALNNRIMEKEETLGIRDEPKETVEETPSPLPSPPDPPDPPDPEVVVE